MNDPRAATIKKPRTCDGCRRQERFGVCGLGYRTERKGETPHFKMTIWGPAEPCPKPKTANEYFYTPRKENREPDA